MTQGPPIPCACLPEVGAPARGLRVLRVLADADESIRRLRAQVVAQADIVEVRRHKDELTCRDTGASAYDWRTERACSCANDLTGQALRSFAGEQITLVNTVGYCVR